jgi:hypothetical protein
MTEKDWKYENDEGYIRVLMEGLTAHAEILKNELQNYAIYFNEHHAPEIAAILEIQFLNMANGLPELAWAIEDILINNGFVDKEKCDFCGGYDTVTNAKEELKDYRNERDDRWMHKLKPDKKEGD